MEKTIIGIFTNRADVEGLIDELKDSGYNPKEMSLVMRDRLEARDISHTTGATVAEGTLAGAATGAALGGLAGLVASTVLPGFGVFFVGGPIAAALGLTGAAASTVTGATTGAVAGGLIGALVSWGVPHEQARLYETRINEGAILLAVPVLMGEELEVRDAFTQYGAEDITSVSTSGLEASTPAYESRRHIDMGYRPHAYAGTKGGRTRKRR